MPKAETAKGLDAPAAQELIGLALKSLTNAKVAAQAKPTIDAALELARESSLAAGKRSLLITGIEVGFVHDVDSEDGAVVTVFNQQPVNSGPDKGTVVDQKKKRIPIAYGGTGYACFLTPLGTYLCIKW